MTSGLFSAVRSSISGLNAYATSVSFRADDVAKAGAVSGKSREAFVLSASTGTSVANFSPGGVSTAVQQYITEIGDVTEADIPTFMALRGPGQFVVTSSPVLGIGQVGFTGNGTFSPDQNGNLCNLAGQFLMAWPTDAKGNVIAVDTTTTQGLIVASTAGLNGPAVPSANVDMKVVLPAGITAGGTELFSAPATIVDSLGIEHKLTFTYQKSTDNPQVWLMTATCSDALSIGVPYSAGMPIQFDAEGNPAIYNWDLTLTTPPPLTITWGNSANPSTLAINAGTLGKSDGIRAIGEPGFDGSGLVADGSPPGNFERCVIDQSTGLMYAYYTNGSQSPFAKIPLALFANANELLEGMGGVYTPTIESGPYRLEPIGQNGAGQIETSKIESSTIDPTQQLTMMIVDQSNFQSNAKVLTVINEMLQATQQIIR